MRRTLPGVIFGLALVLGATSAAAAGQSDSRLFARGSTANVSSDRCTEISGTDRLRCRSLSIDAFSGQTGGSRPSSRFRGTRIEVFILTEVYRPDQRRPIRSTAEFGFVENSDELQLTFDGIRGAALEGDLTLAGTRCVRGDCIETRRDVDVDVSWQARPGPATEVFGYQRVTQGDCERVLSITGRQRHQNVTGHIGTNDLDERGIVSRTDLEQTTVCA